MWDNLVIVFFLVRLFLVLGFNVVIVGDIFFVCVFNGGVWDGNECLGYEWGKSNIVF